MNGIAACGCGAYGKVVEIDPKRTTSTNYYFVIEDQSGNLHRSHVTYDPNERRYRHECKGAPQ